jgi:hypothetical protein
MKQKDKNILRQIEKWTGHEDVRDELFRSVVTTIVGAFIIAAFSIIFYACLSAIF